MAFDIQGPQARFAIEQESDPLLSLPAELGVAVRLFGRIETCFYGSFEVAGAELRQAEAELSALQGAYRAQLQARLRRERQIRATDAEVVARALAPLLAADTMLARLDALLACCRDAIEAGGRLRCEGD